MNTNRIAAFLPDTNGRMTEETDKGFIANPFAPSTPTWQTQLYQAAYLQAQKAQKACRDEWPLAEWWN